MLVEILDGRRSTIATRVEFGAATDKQARLAGEFFNRVKIWAVVNSDKEKYSVALALTGTQYPVEAFSTDDVRLELENLSPAPVGQKPSISSPSVPNSPNAQNP